ncbi:MAG: hypothetical protein LAT56_17360, partial [Wenzhouxiangella sp.]|nr:hypothetical protein [Wenzhouxiangella sp.]
MKYKIQYICPHQAGKVLALIMLLITLPFVLLAAFTKVLGLMSGGMQLAMPTLLIIAPLLYVVAGYLMGVFFSW